MYGQNHFFSFNLATHLIKSETLSDDHHPFALGGLFLDQTAVPPPSFVSLIKAQTFCDETLRFAQRRRGVGGRGGCGFLSVSLSMKGSGEGYVGESRESWGQNGNNKSGEEVENEVDEQVTVASQEEKKKVEEKELGAFNTTKHLFAGAIAAAVSRFDFVMFCFHLLFF